MRTHVPLLEISVIREALKDTLESHECAKMWPAKIDFDFLAKSLVGTRAMVTGAWSGERWEGLIAGYVAPDFHSGELWGYEWLWVVRPDANPDTADQLREVFENTCRLRGCARMVMGMFLGASRSDAAMRRMYRQKGYRPMSESFVKEL